MSNNTQGKLVTVEDRIAYVKEGLDKFEIPRLNQFEIGQDIQVNGYNLNPVLSATVEPRTLNGQLNLYNEVAFNVVSLTYSNPYFTLEVQGVLTDNYDSQSVIFPYNNGFTGYDIEQPLTLENQTAGVSTTTFDVYLDDSITGSWNNIQGFMIYFAHSIQFTDLHHLSNGQSITLYFDSGNVSVAITSLSNTSISIILQQSWFYSTFLYAKVNDGIKYVCQNPIESPVRCLYENRVQGLTKRVNGVTSDYEEYGKLMNNYVETLLDKEAILRYYGTTFTGTATGGALTTSNSSISIPNETQTIVLSTPTGNQRFSSLKDAIDAFEEGQTIYMYPRSEPYIEDKHILAKNIHIHCFKNVVINQLQTSYSSSWNVPMFQCLDNFDFILTGEANFVLSRGGLLSCNGKVHLEFNNLTVSEIVQIPLLPGHGAFYPYSRARNPFITIVSSQDCYIKFNTVEAADNLVVAIENPDEQIDSIPNTTIIFNQYFSDATCFSIGGHNFYIYGNHIKVGLMGHCIAINGSYNISHIYVSDLKFIGKNTTPSAANEIISGEIFAGQGTGENRTKINVYNAKIVQDLFLVDSEYHCPGSKTITGELNLYNCDIESNTEKQTIQGASYSSLDINNCKIVNTNALGTPLEASLFTNGTTEIHKHIIKNTVLEGVGDFSINTAGFNEAQYSDVHLQNVTMVGTIDGIKMSSNNVQLVIDDCLFISSVVGSGKCIKSATNETVKIRRPFMSNVDKESSVTVIGTPIVIDATLQ